MLVTQLLVSPVVLRARQHCTTAMRYDDDTTDPVDGDSIAEHERSIIHTTTNNNTNIAGGGASTNGPHKEMPSPTWDLHSNTNGSRSSCESAAATSFLLKETTSHELAPLRGVSPLSITSSSSSSVSSDSETRPTTSTEQKGVSVSSAPLSLTQRRPVRPLSASLPASLPSSTLRLRSSLRSSHSSRSYDAALVSPSLSLLDGTNTNDGQRPTVRRSVSFDDSNHIFPIEHVNKIHRRERSRRWFNSMDLAHQRSENDRLLELMEMTGSFNEKQCFSKLKGETNPAEKYTIRGLERQTIQGRTLYYEQYRDAVMAVLVQQQMSASGGSKKKRNKQSSSSPDSHHQNSLPTPIIPSDVPDLIAASYQRETARAQKQAVQQGKLDAKEVKVYLSEANCNIDSIRLMHVSERQKEQKKSFLRKPFAKRTNSSSTLSNSIHSGSGHGATR